MNPKQLRPLSIASSLFMGLMVIASLFAFAAPAAAQTPQPASGATVTASVNTNCRTGPSTVYTVVGYLMANQSSPAVGRLTDNTWWQIQNPGQTGATCWVWSGSTQLTGDAATLAASAPPQGYYSPTYPSYGSLPYNGYGYGMPYYMMPPSWFYGPGRRFLHKQWWWWMNP